MENILENSWVASPRLCGFQFLPFRDKVVCVSVSSQDLTERLVTCSAEHCLAQWLWWFSTFAFSPESLEG